MPTAASRPKHNVLVYVGMLALALAGTVVVLLGVGAMLAERWQVDTSRPVTGSAEQVRVLVHDFATWSDWSSLQANLGPSTHREIRGTPGTVGQQLTWSGALGVATLTMTAVAADSVSYDFHQQDPGEATPRLLGRGTIRWQQEGTGAPVCRVAWHEEVVLDSLLLRWWGWFGAVQDRVKQIQGTSLAGLQQTIDAAAKSPPPK